MWATQNGRLTPEKPKSMDTIARREPLAHAGIGSMARIQPPKRHGMASALRRWCLRFGLTALLGGPAALLAAPPPSQPAPVPWYEARAHLVGELPVLTLPWRGVSTDVHSDAWSFRITVNEQGRVTAAMPLYGQGAYRAQAERLVRALVFRPFEDQGRPVTQTVELPVEGRLQDYVGPVDRRFPDRLDANQVKVILERTECFGDCPAYTVELLGNGQVTYRGRSHVAVAGVHRWRVPPETVTALLARFKEAEFLQLKGHYVAEATDLPTYTTVLQLGAQKKFVLNYGGAMTFPKGVMASTSSGAEGPGMPPIVTELEDAIDATAGTRSWVEGDDQTLGVLLRAGWNPRSRAAGRVLAVLTSRCASSAAADWVRAGAPVIATQETGAPIVGAARCGDLGLVRLLAQHGGLQRRVDAQGLLDTGAQGGHPEFVALALAHGATVRPKRAPGGLAMPLFLAGEAVQDLPRTPVLQAAEFDPAQVVTLMLAAGADPRERDSEGNTPLHHTWNAAAVEALIRGGADVHATNRDGETALFRRMDADVAQALLKAGADVHARDHDGRTALFHHQWPAVVEALVRAGADVNAKDKDGFTALETALDERVALVLLAAGANWPSDPTRWDAFAAKAQDRQWTQLLPLLAAARRGASTP